jgi:hypothetical protein
MEIGGELLKLLAVVFIYNLAMDKDMFQPAEEDKYTSIRNSVGLSKYYLNTVRNQESLILAFTFYFILIILFQVK